MNNDGSTGGDRLYYVTCWNGKQDDDCKIVAVLGPFDTHDEALDSVSEGRDLVWAADPRAPWYSFGTTSISKDEQRPNVVFDKTKKKE